MAPTNSQVLDIARKAIDIFAKHGLKCCLTGGVASQLYGVSRTPSVSPAKPDCSTLTEY